MKAPRNPHLATSTVRSGRSIAKVFLQTTPWRAGLACLVALTLGMPATAGSLYWDTNGVAAGAGGATPSGSWDGTTANWSTEAAGNIATTTWTSGETAVFSAGSDATGLFTVTLSESKTAGSLVFEEGSASLAGAGVTLNGTGLVTVNASAKGTIASVVSGSVGLTKAGSGELVLSGANSFTGSLTARAGMVTLDNNNAAGVGSVVVPTAASGAAGNVIFRTTTGASLTNEFDLQVNGYLLDFAPAAGKTLTLSGALSGGHNWSMSGMGTLRLDGANPNTCSGNIVVSQGTLVALKDGALGPSGGNGTLVSPGASLAFDGGVFYYDSEPVSVSGIGVGGSGAIKNISSINEFDGNITLAGDTRFGSDSGYLALVGTISGNHNITKVGPGGVDLYTSNSYNNTIVSEGTLGVWFPGSAGVGPASIAAGARLEGDGDLPGGVNLSGTVSPGASPAQLDSGAQTWNGGATYEWEVNDATGTLGIAFDHLNITGGLTVAATTSSKVTIKIISLEPTFDTAGDAVNFDNTQTNEWVIAATTSGIIGFDAGKFALDDTGFSNDKGGGSFVLLANGNDLVLRFDPAPVVTCPSDIAQVTDPGQCSASVAFAATANEPGVTFLYETNGVAITSPHVFPKGATQVDVTATDSVGNTDSCSFNVTVSDAESPTVACQDVSVQLDANGLAGIAPNDVFLSGNDNCGVVNLVSVSPDSFTYCDLGPNLVTLTVNDGNGNLNTCTATVTVTAPPTPAVVYVDDDYPSTCAAVDFPSNGVAGPHYVGFNAFNTLQAAINAVASGGTINIAAGSYPEVGQIVIGKDLTLLGESQATTILKPTGDTGSADDARGWIVVDDNKNVSVEKVTLDGTGWKIHQAIRHKGSGTISDCAFTNIQYEASGPAYQGTAIAIHSTNNVDVTGCSFAGIGRNGIASYDIYWPLPATGPTGTYSGNTYVGKGTGDWLDYAFLIQGGANVVLENNQISDCLGIASVDGSGSSGIAIWDDPATQATVTGNTMTGNSVGLAVAIWYGGTSDPQVVVGAGNTFSGGEIGVDIENVGGVPSANPAVTFGASTFKGQSSHAIHLGPDLSAGTTFDISAAVFKDAGDAVITDDFAKEDLVYHALDAAGLGLFIWNAGNVYVTPNSGSIQRGIDAATAGDTVNIDAGTFTENVTLNKHVSLLGAGSDAGTGTVLAQSAAGAGNSTIGVVQLAASGASGNPMLLQGLRIEPAGIAGISVGTFPNEVAPGTVVEYVSLDDVAVVGNHTAPCTEQERGLGVGKFSTLRHFQLADCRFEDLNYGWYVMKSVDGSVSTVEDVQVLATVFINNTSKGIYAEKLSDATFTSCEFLNNGDSGADFSACSYFLPWLAGVDINLKDGTYGNLVFDSCDIIGNGLGAKEGVGLAVKARDDGPTYGAFPATVTAVTVMNCRVAGNERGLRFGEPGKNNATPTGVVVHECLIAGNVQTYAGSDGSAYGGLLNQCQGAIDAETNWWASIRGPTHPGNVGGDGQALVDASTGATDFSPWLGDGSDTSSDVGFQPNPAPVYHTPAYLVFSQQPGSALQGVAFGQQPVVQVMNEVNQLAAQYQGTVSMAIDTDGSGAGATLGGTTVISATGGVATFTDLSLDKGGTGFTLAASAPAPITGDTSAAFDVTIPAIVYVDDGYVGQPAGTKVDWPWSGSPNPSGAHTIGYDAFATIQGGIDALLPGGVANIAAGLYAENVNANKPVALLGPNTAISPNGGSRVAEAVVVPAVVDVEYGEVIHIEASSVTVAGLTVDGDNASLSSGILGTTGADLDASDGVAVYVDNVNNLTVSNNIIRNLSFFGVSIFGASYGAPSTSGHLVHDNRFEQMGTYDTAAASAYKWGGGVLLYNDQYAAVTDNVMLDVRIGIQTGNFHDPNPGAATYQMISGNEIQARRRGIFHNLFTGSPAPVDLVNNTITALADANETVWDGILLSSLDVDCLAQNNNIDGSAVTVPSEGYEVWNVAGTHTVTLQGGSVAGVDKGVWANNYEGYASDGSYGAHVTLDGLSISASDIGVCVSDSPSSTLHAPVAVAFTGTVQITGASTGVAISGGSASVADLADTALTGQTGNYIELAATAMAGNELNATSASFDGQLGSAMSLADLFAAEDKIQHAVDDATVGLARVNAANLYVTLNSGSIQRGINAATAGDTVNVNDGTYDGRLTINKTVTLLSANGSAATTITNSANVGLGTLQITGPSTGVQIGDSGRGFTVHGIDSPSPGVEWAAVYFQGNHTNASVIGNTIVAAGDAGLQTEYGAKIDGLTLSENTFSGQTFIGPNPAGSGFTGASDQFTLPNVPRQLVVISGGSGGGSHKNITFTCNSVTGIAGGINTSSQPQGNTLVTIDAVGATIENNTFTGITTRYAESLRVRGPNAVVAGNTLAGSSPIGVQIYTPASPTTSVTNNNFGGTYGAALVNGGTLLDAENNWWASPSGPTYTNTNPGGNGGLVIGLVDISPWLGTSSDVSGACGFQPDLGIVYYQPDHLEFLVEPGDAALAQVLPTQPVVRVIDENGGVASQFNGSVAVAIGNNPGSGVLTGTATAPVVAGVTAFTDLAVTTGGGEAFTLVASSAYPVVPATSATFDITNTAPVLTHLNPAGAVTGSGSGSVNVTLTGSGFVPTSVVLVDGSSVTRTVNSDTVITATLSTATAGTFSVVVSNPPPPSGGSVSGSLPFVVGGTPNVVFVDDNYGPGNSGSHSWGYDAFATVQNGVSAVASGGTVNVAAGNYAEAVTIGTSLSLLGANAGVACGGSGESVIDAGLGVAITIAANNVTVDGFHLKGGTGVSNTGFIGAAIQNNQVTAGTLGIGLSAVAGAFTVQDNCVTLTAQVGGSGPTVGMALAGTSTAATTIVEDNAIAGAFYGYLLYGLNSSPAVSVKGGTITGAMQGVAAINLGPAPFATPAPSTFVVDGVNMSGFTGDYSAVPALEPANFHAGVYVYTAGASPVGAGITATLTGVTVDGTGKPSQASAGLYFADFSTIDADMQEITVESCTLINNKNRGVDVTGKNALVAINRSTLADNGADPYVSGGNDGFGIIARNGAQVSVDETFVTNPGMQLSGTVTALATINTGVPTPTNLPTLTVTGSSILANGNGSLAQQSSGTLDGSGNWWGNTAEGTIAGLMTGTVDFTPYLGDGTDTDLGTAGFQGDFGTLHVTLLGAQTGSPGRIQEGIDLTTASTVIIEAGTYVENILANKDNLELAGVGQNLVTVVPALSAPNPGSASSLAPGASHLILVSGDNVTIHDLTLDGDNPGLTSGVLSGGVDVDARNGIIEDYTQGVFNGLEVSNVTVKNIYLRGIYASSGGSGFNIHHNTLQNVQGDPASIALFNYAGSGTFAFNVVSDANDAIAANHSRGTSFLTNTVSNCGSGVHTDNAGDGGGTADLIQGNTVNAGPLWSYGIWVFVPYIAPTVADNVVVGNTIGMGAFGGAFSSPTVTPVFSNNQVDGQGGPDSVGMYVSSTTFYWGSTDVQVDMLGNTLVNNQQGIYVESLGGTNLAAVRILDNTTRLNVGAGVVADGALAKVMLQNNDLTANGGGAIQVLNGAIVDAGDCTGGDVTGLGSSAGGNNLTGYGFDSAAPHAIENLNGTTPVVLAHQNSYGAAMGDDVSALMSGPVAFSQSGGLLVQCLADVGGECLSSVPAAATDAASWIAQGGMVSSDPVTVTSTDTVVNSGQSDRVITRDYALTDACGQTAYCTQTITIDDVTPPTVVCQPVSKTLNPGDTQVTVTPAEAFNAGASADNCAVTVTPVSVVPDTFYCGGIYTVLLTATDGNGNDNTCSATVTVTDNRAAPVVVYVDDDYVGLPNGTSVLWPAGVGPTSALIGCDAFATIQAGVDRVASPGTVNAAAGTYNEDVLVNKAINILGAGAGNSVVIGQIGGDGATFRVAAAGILLDGFSITRAGNNPADWNNPGLNFAGIAMQGQTVNATIQNCDIYGNRTGIDINNSNGSVIRNNRIADNRTGMLLRNQTDNLVVTENEIADNWTMGVLFLDASSGSNVPVQTSQDSAFSNNDISGNWYGQIVDRQTGGSLPAPGTNLKDFSGNWLGTTAPVVSTANSAEPGYSAQIPVAYGGTAVPPGGQPDICGPASANFDYTPWLDAGTDTDVSTGFGAFGFQGDFSTLHVDDDGAQVGAVGRIQEGIDLVSASTVYVHSGTYTEGPQILVAKDVSLIGDGLATTTIKPAANTGASGDARGWWLVQPCYTLDLSDVTLDGTGRLVYQAIRHKGKGTFTNVRFTELKYQESGPTYGGLAVAAFGGCGAVDFSNCVFDEIGRVGVLYYGAGTTGTFANNTYAGKGAGDWLDYALDISAGAVVAANGNTISGNLGVASTDNSTSAGILATTYFGPGTTASVLNNSITGNTHGLAVGYDNGDTSALLLQGNTLSANTAAAIQVVGAALVDMGDLLARNLTGLGSSTGGNDLSGYGFDESAPWAIEASGTAAPGQVLAYECDFGAAATADINSLITDGFDTPGLVIVEFSQTGPLTAVPPTAVTVECSGDIPVAAIDLAGYLAQGGVVSASPISMSTSNWPAAWPAGDFTLTRTYTLTDASGRTASVDQIITVDDQTAPVISCPPDIAAVTSDGGTGDCVASVAITPATATDNCTGAGNITIVGTRSDSLPLTDPYPKGATIITWVATDESGLSDTCDQTVTVTDDEKPVLTLGTIDPCYQTAAAAEAAAVTATVVTDNCPEAVSVVAVASGTCSATVTVTATDAAGNSDSVTYTGTRIDPTAPTITSTTATQNAVDVANCATNAQVGTVNITVAASDNCGLSGPPAVTLVNGVASESAVFGTESPPGTYNYTWAITTATPNGSWTVTATASDLCQTDVETFAICVNKSQVSGLVQLEGFTGTAVGHSRLVTFVATTNWMVGTNINSTVLKTWNLTLINTSGDTFSYLLTDVPGNANGISAKTDWNLREKLAITLDGFGQATADFVSDGTSGWSDATDHYLRGADIEHSALSVNRVNLPDYSTFATAWLGTDPVADITGDGIVNLFDYSILAVNYFKAGDNQ